MTARKNFPALTGIRAFAAYLVFLHHYTPPFALWGGAISGVLHQGYVGVSIFYVLSGFLIHQAYGQSDGRILRPRYFINRFARIYPLYFLLLIADFCKSSDRSWSSVFMNFTLIKGFFDQWKFSHIAQAWSLTVEECFYAVAPLLFWIQSRKKVATVLLTPIFYALGFALMFIGWKFNITGFFRTYLFISLYTFPGRCFEFLIGIYFSRILNSQEKLFWPLSIVKTLWRGGACTYSGLVLFLLGVIGVYFVGNHLGEEAAIVTLPGAMICNWLLPVFIGALIYGLATENTMLSRLLSSTVMNRLGRSSYAFYLIQQGIIIDWLWKYSSTRLSIFCELLIVSYALYSLVEHPLNVLIRNRLFVQKKAY